MPVYVFLLVFSIMLRGHNNTTGLGQYDGWLFVLPPWKIITGSNLGLLSQAF